MKFLLDKMGKIEKLNNFNNYDFFYIRLKWRDLVTLNLVAFTENSIVLTGLGHSIILNMVLSSACDSNKNAI